MNKFVVYTIVSLISTFGLAYLYYKITEANKKINLKTVVVFIIGVLLITLVKYSNFAWLSAISYFLYFPFLFLILHYLSFGKFLFYFIIVWIIAVVVDVLSMLLVLLLQLFYEFDIYSYIARIVLSFFAVVAYILLARSRKFSNTLNNVYKKVRRINYFDFTLVAFAIFASFIGFVIFLSLDNINVSVLLVVVLFLLSFSFALLLKVRINLIENDIFLKLLKKNNEFYLEIEDENRIFRHNLIAKLLSIKSVSGKKARELIDDFVKSFNTNIDFSLQIKDMPYGLNGIIYEKIYPYIGKIDIKIDNKINFDIFKILKPRRYNVFVEKMIIALDNAIESCLTSVDKVLIINLYSEDNNIIVDIKNTFSTNLNLDSLGKINYSTKSNDKKKRGLGLFSALRDNEVSLQLKIVNDLFVTKIVAKQNVGE